MMKKTSIAWTIAVLSSFVGGFILADNIRYQSSLEREITTHYCLCIEEKPEYYPRLLEAASMVQSEIDRQTAAFVKAHKIHERDFQTIFVPSTNGNYEMVFHCSHRKRDVTDLLPGYKELMNTCLTSYRRIVREAHGVES